MSETITATTEVQSVTLTKDEVWWNHGVAGALVSDGAEPATLGDYAPLNHSGGSLPFDAGVTVYYRSARSAPARITRVGRSG